MNVRRPLRQLPLDRLSLHRARQLAPAVSSLMTPVAATGYAMALWRLGSDLNWFSTFFISSGLLSRWQVWFALAVATQVAAQQIRRSSSSGSPQTRA